MAQGDVEVFDQYMLDAFLKLHDMSADTINVALVDGTIVPTADLADPAYGAGGTNNMATDECANGGNYTTGGKLCDNPTATLVGGALQIDFDNPTVWTQLAGSPTDARYGILYNDSSVGKKCIGFIDLGSVFDMTSGDLTITWGAPFHTIDQV